MWFILSIVAMLCWSGSDLFSKIGCNYADDKYNHLKMTIAVGVVMGLHAAYEIFIGGTEIIDACGDLLEHVEAIQKQ